MAGPGERFPRRNRRRVLIVSARALALYAFAAWVYVALVALIQPDRLSWRLTHFSKWPRTDTFGELCFLISFAAFWAYTLLREPPDPASPER